MWWKTYCLWWEKGDVWRSDGLTHHSVLPVTSSFFSLDWVPHKHCFPSSPPATLPAHSAEARFTVRAPHTSYTVKQSFASQESFLLNSPTSWTIGKLYDYRYSWRIHFYLAIFFIYYRYTWKGWCYFDKSPPEMFICCSNRCKYNKIRKRMQMKQQKKNSSFAIKDFRCAKYGLKLCRGSKFWCRR